MAHRLNRAGKFGDRDTRVVKERPVLQTKDRCEDVRAQSPFDRIWFSALA